MNFMGGVLHLLQMIRIWCMGIRGVVPSSLTQKPRLPTGLYTAKEWRGQAGTTLTYLRLFYLHLRI